jgi:hypothetical protein
MQTLVELFSMLTGLVYVTGPAVVLYFSVAILSLFVAAGPKMVAVLSARYPRFVAFLGVLQALGLDPKKLAESAKSVLSGRLKETQKKL